MAPKREKKEYSFEVIETGKNLYIYKQKTYEEIAKITGVPVVTIQRWSKKYEWRKKKIDQIKRRVDYRKNLYDLRDRILENARETTDPQIIHALVNLQRTIESEEKMKPMEDLPADPGKGLGLSPETLEKIKEEIYGIRKPEIRNPGIQEK
jgi:transposase